MAPEAQPKVDRFVIAATIDRLIYDSDLTFNPDDARLLLSALPRRKSPWFELGLVGKYSGGSAKGFAAGVGSVKVKDDKERQFRYSTAADAYTRIGQWKLIWRQGRARQYVEIEQVMANAIDDARGAQIHYAGDSTPLSMDIRVNRSFRLFWSPIIVVIPGWQPWKSPSAFSG
jgi:hypothetical protein